VLEELLHVYAIVVFGMDVVRNIAAKKIAIPPIRNNRFNVYYYNMHYKNTPEHLALYNGLDVIHHP
jgi:hypothetical protein